MCCRWRPGSKHRTLRANPGHPLDAAAAGTTAAGLAVALHWLVHARPLASSARFGELAHSGTLSTLRCLKCTVQEGPADEDLAALGEMLVPPPKRGGGEGGMHRPCHGQVPFKAA